MASDFVHWTQSEVLTLHDEREVNIVLSLMTMVLRFQNTSLEVTTEECHVCLTCGSNIPGLLYRRRLITASLATRLNLQVQITASLATWPFRLDSHAAPEMIWVSVMMMLERVAKDSWLQSLRSPKRVGDPPKSRNGGLRGPNLGYLPNWPFDPPKPTFGPKTPQKPPFLPFFGLFDPPKPTFSVLYLNNILIAKWQKSCRKVCFGTPRENWNGGEGLVLHRCPYGQIPPEMQKTLFLGHVF